MSARISAQSSTAQSSTAHQSEPPAETGMLQHASLEQSTAEELERSQDLSSSPPPKQFQDSNFKQNFSRVPMRGGMNKPHAHWPTVSPVVQAKLTIGQPDDKYEREADRVAAQVMAMPAPETTVQSASRIQSPSIQSPSIQHLNPTLGAQRQATELADEDEELLQAKRLPGNRVPSAAEILIQRQAENEQLEEDEDEVLQAKADGSRHAVRRGSSASSAPSLAPGAGIIQGIRASRGGGQPLSPPVRNFMEPRFNHDFSQVRVHTDSAASRMAKGLNAQAFTHKQDIFFGAGQYQPETHAGRQLLAHELTHTVQQQPRAQLKAQLKVQPGSARAIAQTVGSEEIVSLRQGDGPTVVPSVAPLAVSTGVEPAVPTSEKTVSDKPENELSLSSSQSGAAIEAEVVPIATESVSETADSKASGESEKTEETTEKIDSVSEKEQGNKAQGGDVLEKAIAKAPASAAEDPAFQAVVKRAKGIAKQQKTHAPARSEASSAQAAAVPPANELVSKGQERQVQELSEQQPGTFNADAFIDALMTKIAEIAPKDEKAAEKFETSNQLATVKQSVSAQVSKEKQQAADPIAKKNKEAPSTSGFQSKSVKPLVEKGAGPKPKNLKANQAAPKAKTAAEVSQPLEKNSQQLDQQMTAGEVTDAQLATSNEPTFTAALAAKQETQAHAKTGPEAYRKDETAILSQAQNQAQGAGQAQVAGMHGQRGKLLTQVMGQQLQTKGQDEAARAKVAATINGIYDKTKTDVTTILAGLDTAVDQRFEAGAKVAKQRFEAYVGREMDAYKEKRYGAWYDVWGYGKRLRDRWYGLPPEVGIIFERGRDLYVGLMRNTLRGIANHVAATLTQAKQRIAAGKKKLQSYVVGLAPSLQKVGQEATTAIQGKFDQLEAQVNSKQAQLVDSLAQKYQENLKTVNARIEQLQKENKGLLARAKGLIVGTIKTILKLKEMLLQVLAKAAATVKIIIKDPIGFLGNLIKGLKLGFQNFVKNILKHLQSGLIGWLTGALGPIGIQIPEDVFSLKGIFSLVTQILGVTWDFIRRRAVKLFGEKTVSVMEKSVEIVQILIKDGVGGLWKHLQDQFTDLKESVLGEIKNLVMVQVVQAGVKWVLGLLNPASAFVKAAMAIYDIVMFFVNRGSQIIELMKAVVDSVAAVASGSVGAAAQKIEGALARTVPVVIGFLAALLGINGLAKKVQGIVERLRKRVEAAIDKLLIKIRKIFKKKKTKTSKATGRKNRFEKDFKESNGFSHELTINLAGPQPDIKVASATPTGVQHQIQDRRKAEPPLNTDQDKSLKLAWNQHDHLVKLSGKYLKANEENDRKRIEQQITSYMDRLTKNMVEGDAWSDIEDLQPTKVTFSKTGGHKQVVANPLTKLPGDTVGSAAKDVLPAWRANVPNQTSGRGGNLPWRRVHLLSDKLHGPGNNPENLIPAVETTNGDLRRGPEREAYKRIRRGETLKYTARVTNNDPNNSFFPASPRGVHITVEKIVLGNPNEIIYDDSVRTQAAPTGIPQLTPGQITVVDTYEDLVKNQGIKKPTHQQIADEMNQTRRNISIIISNIRKLIGEVAPPLPAELQRAREILDL